jgi:hypothetical protein
MMDIVKMVMGVAGIAIIMALVRSFIASRLTSLRREHEEALKRSIEAQVEARRSVEEYEKKKQDYLSTYNGADPVNGGPSPRRSRVPKEPTGEDDC